MMTAATTFALSMVFVSPNASRVLVIEGFSTQPVCMHAGSLYVDAPPATLPGWHVLYTCFPSEDPNLPRLIRMARR